MSDKPLQKIHGLFGTILPVLVAAVAAAGAVIQAAAAGSDPTTGEGLVLAGLALAVTWAIDRLGARKTEQAIVERKISSGSG